MLTFWGCLLFPCCIMANEWAIMAELLLLLSLSIIISQGLQCRLNLNLLELLKSECTLFCTLFVRMCLLCMSTFTPFSNFWKAIMSPDEPVKASAVWLSLTSHLASSSLPVPLSASPHAGHNRNRLVASSSLHPSHLSQLYFPANYLVVRAPNATYRFT